MRQQKEKDFTLYMKEFIKLF